jgi:glutathione synthase/RimK-type ligase-like ATP-grasp enzyme
VAARGEVWDDTSVRWDAYDLVVVRSTWDYHERREDFLEWAASLPNVLNPLPVLVWNTDKTYLRDLHANGVQTVPTIWIEPGTDLEALALPRGEVVVKPAVSAGSSNTERYADAREPAAQEHVRRLLGAGRTVMVQPYVATVDAEGEAGLVYIDGAYSHAVNKAATLIAPGAAEGKLFAAEQIVPIEPATEQRAVADAALDALQWPRRALLYARVDVVRSEGGRPIVLEIELTEPSLYFGCGEGSPDRLAAAIARRL